MRSWTYGGTKVAFVGIATPESFDQVHAGLLPG